MKHKKSDLWVNFGPKKDLDGLPETARYAVNTKGLFLRFPVIVERILLAGHKKINSAQKTTFLGPKRATLGNLGHETACQVTNRPLTRKPKLSRVTSGYGGRMVPLSQVRLSRKHGGFIWAKNAVFWPKIYFFGNAPNFLLLS